MVGTHQATKSFKNKWCDVPTALQWGHTERDGVSNHRRLDRLLRRLFRRRAKKTSKLRVTGLCEGNPPVTGGFPSQRASNAEIFPFDDVMILEQWERSHLIHVHESRFNSRLLPKGDPYIDNNRHHTKVPYLTSFPLRRYESIWKSCYYQNGNFWIDPTSYGIRTLCHENKKRSFAERCLKK